MIYREREYDDELYGDAKFALGKHSEMAEEYNLSPFYEPLSKAHLAGFFEYT